MGKYLKIILISIFVLLVVFAAVADRPIVPKMIAGLQLAPYLRLAGLLGLVIAVFLAWGYKRRMEASQKFIRAQEVLDQAGEKAERLKRESERLEQDLRAEYEQRKLDLDERISEIKQDYEERLMALKEQNIELKESVGKLMQIVKNSKAS